MKKRTIYIVIAFHILLLLSYMNYKKNELLILDGFTQGTTYHIVYKQPYSLGFILNRNIHDYQEEIDSLLIEFDRTFSIYLPRSVISRINNNDKDVKVDSLFRKVFNKAKEVNELSDGAFDITVGPIVNAWGFGPELRVKIDSALIDSLIQFVGMDKVRIEKERVIKSDPGVKLDVNAIAQGYSTDIVAGFLSNKGIKNYLVEIGGEISAAGTKKKGTPWKVGVDKPYDNNYIPGMDLQVILAMKDNSMATSGNYRKFFEENGVKYSHSIDPKTGYPVIHNLLSVTVTAQDCISADAFATAFMIMGLEKSIKLVRKLDGIEAYFIYSDDKGDFCTEITDGFREIIIEVQE
ncbi:MAG: FAD:protein FMN transferase [Bacteroidales bacterium]|nr:FAD:protein FMN transferase [Bacteroidales bacterium]